MRNKPTSMNEVIVRCRNLAKSFPIPGGGENKVLKGIDLEVSRGEFIALMGPSGCGKSTLLNIIGAMLSPTAGEVEVNGRGLKGLKHMDLTQTRRHEGGRIF